MTSERPTLPGPPYFFLSYVPRRHTTTAPRATTGSAAYYHDLNLAIDGRPGDRVRRQGFADFMVRPPEADGTKTHRAGRGRGVRPAVSPDYLNRDDSRREREWFRQRLIRAGRPPDGDNILPVLWIPSPAALHAPDQSRPWRWPPTWTCTPRTA
ncbi:hypothetical protein V2I01_12355 [Micromonospora sp. BRA006-A]|nr:hypothetical protein [Micromonospora sp. BRA006-A]